MTSYQSLIATAAALVIVNVWFEQKRTKNILRRNKNPFRVTSSCVDWVSPLLRSALFFWWLFWLFLDNFQNSIRGVGFNVFLIFLFVDRKNSWRAQTFSWKDAYRESRRVENMVDASVGAIVSFVYVFLLFGVCWRRLKSMIRMSSWSS